MSAPPASQDGAGDAAPPTTPDAASRAPALPPRVLLLALVVAALAAWAGSRARSAPQDTVWQAPGLIELATADGEATARDLTRDRGRLRARRDLDAVLAWIPGPQRLELFEPAGALQLVLGERDGRGLVVSVDDETIGWRLVGAADESLAGSAPREALSHLTLERDGEGPAWRLLADGRELAELDGSHLAAEVLGRIGFTRGASLAGFSVRTASGSERRVDLAGDAAGHVSPLWAGLAAALAVLAASSWWALLRRRREPAGLDRLLAAVVALALLVCPAEELLAHNRERLAGPVPAGPDEALVREGPFELFPGRPLDLTRRDADARLVAQLSLAADTVVDVSVRRDGTRCVIACLSTAADVPSGVVWNRGDRVDLQPAPELLRQLAADVPVSLRIDGTGPEVRVRVDERVLGRVWDWDLRAGSTAVHVLRGRATLSDLSLASLGEPEDTSPHLQRWRLGLWLVVGAALVLLASLSGAARPWPLCWLWTWPLAAAALPGLPDGLMPLAAATAGVCLLPGAPAGWRRPLTWLVGGALIACLCWAEREGPHVVEAHQLSLLTPAEVEGGPYPARLLWARHPLSRRFHPFVADQGFRGRRLPDERAALRVAATGGSSTFGYGVPPERAWPAALEKRLAAGGADVQVLNAGVPGVTVWRLVSFVEELLLDCDLDLLIVSVGFNDHPVGAVWREAEHLAAMTGDGIGPLEGAFARWQQERRQQAWNVHSHELLKGLEPDADSLRVNAIEPAERFAAGLAAILAACREKGTELVLIQEPCRGGGDRPLLEPYRRALAALAADEGLTVIEPQPALDAEGGDGLFLDTVHPTAAGHWIEAREIAAGLVAAGLVDG